MKARHCANESQTSLMHSSVLEYKFSFTPVNRVINPKHAITTHLSVISVRISLQHMQLVIVYSHEIITHWQPTNEL